MLPVRRVHAWSALTVLLTAVGLGACVAGPGGGPMPTPTLTDTTWRLVALGDVPVAPSAAPAGQPHLVLHAAEARLSGSGGCNRLVGRWRADAEALSFSQIATTRMACPTGMEQESRFLAALASVARHRRDGGELVLIDARGAVVARLRADDPR